MPGTHLLLVDDDPLIVTGLEAALRQHKYITTCAGSGREALALLEDSGKKIDLALVDIRMPDMSGTELATELINRYEIPTLFLSAFSSRGQIEEAVSKGGIGYVVKPVDVPQLLPAIEMGLARAKDLKALHKLQAQLQQALDSNRDINVCIGILMERMRLTRNEAFDHLRQYARSNQVKLDKLAEVLVDACDKLNQVEIGGSVQKTRGEKGRS